MDVEEGAELFVKYDITVDGDGLKSALKTALTLGQIFSGKSRKEFAKEVKPYLKVDSQISKPQIEHSVTPNNLLLTQLCSCFCRIRRQNSFTKHDMFSPQMVSDVVKNVKMKDLIKFS